MSRAKTLADLKSEMDNAADIYHRHPSPFLRERAIKTKQAYVKALNKEYLKANPKPQNQTLFQ
jgi:hypothetical protein